MTNLNRNRKAVSPVIASVLMILVVMAGMTILFAFVADYAQSFKVGSGSAVLESLTVEDIWYNPSSNKVELWVYNVGKVDLKIANIYVNNNPAILENPKLDSQGNIAVVVGAHEKILVVAPPEIVNFIPGQSYNYKIVTGRGSGFQGTMNL